MEEDVFQYGGWAERSHSVPIDSNTIFDIASLNKSFIANLTLQAIAENRWSLDTRLNDLLKKYHFIARFNPEIDLHQMLCHRSGLADYDQLDVELRESEFRRFKRMHFKNAEYLEFLAVQNHLEPNHAFYYSNFAYHILAILLEEEYKMPFDQLLKLKIGAPLGMRTICSPEGRRKVLPHLATGYCFVNGEYLANDYIDLSLGRRIFCNAHDLMLWLEADGGTVLLPKHLADEVHRNQVSDLDSMHSYGYGWVPYNKGDSFVMGDLDLNQSYFIHGGSTEGFQSLAISVNKGETKLVLLANDGQGRLLMEKAKSILKELYES